ncbi:hypothetical protein HAL013_06420 [Helicobacter ailurogastricus]|uniref:Uncharacterized protein n=1 Tax=Helicobacter ailurogastricus TaxID=1578720 RepID=A0A0K2X8S2_9HELI|nr:hypothetical protein HAL011_05180 [Helicobacter ailurogastricus]CRF42461.1 hypothetical protein HAL013_06420 [Helicobacter ailurogastricus]CRF43655.1 hypothetical protein HAL09_02020 [Helicobacter ailurogastricus]
MINIYKQMLKNGGLVALEMVLMVGALDLRKFKKTQIFLILGSF